MANPTFAVEETFQALRVTLKQAIQVWEDPIPSKGELKAREEVRELVNQLSELYELEEKRSETLNDYLEEDE